MADTASPLTPGPSTSEGKIAIASTVLGVLAAVIPPLWTAFSNLKETYPQVTWIAGIVSVLGVVTTLLTALGYGSQRTALKQTAIQAAAVAAQGSSAAPSPK